MQRATVDLQQRGMTQRAPAIVAGVRRPAFLTSRTTQLVVYVRDSSPSMEGSKAVDASAAGSDLITELVRPENKDGFMIAVVDFAGHAAIVQAAAKATATHGCLAAIDTHAFGGSTNIADGLRKAMEAIGADEAPQVGERMRLRPVVILFSDGMANEGGDPALVAGPLKQRADLVTVAFGTDADESVLRALATSAQHFYRCQNGKELRAFLASVGKTLTQTYSRGINATAALGQLGQQSR